MMHWTTARRRFALLTLVAVLAVVGVVGRARDADRLHSNLDTALEVALLVRLQYVDPVSVTDLLSAYMATDTIEGMLESLGDEYTRYMDREAYKAYSEDVEGTYSGIGIHVGLRNGQTTVIAPMPDTPADRAGLASGDIIVAIDGKSTENMSLEEAVSLMKGPEGTRVVLTIQRGEDPLREVQIVRARITVPVVDYEMLEDGLGYVGIVTFTADTAEQTQRALDSLISQGAKGVVLDLRWNGGGLFDQAILVASMFVEDGPIVHRVGRDGIRNTHVKSTNVPQYDLPMVVLVNEWSASSSEILAGALKDTNRAYLVGTQTFGKGVVQGVFPLSDGGALSLTTDRYLTAGGHSIHGEGITPDFIVELPVYQTAGTQDEESPVDKSVANADDLLDSPQTTASEDGGAPVAGVAGDDGVTETPIEDGGDSGVASADETDSIVVEDTQLIKAMEVLRSAITGEAIPIAS